MDDLHALAPAQARQPADVERHLERVLRGGGKRQADAALGLQLADEAAAFRGDQRARAGRGEAGGDVDGGALGAPRIELGNDLEDAGAGERRGVAGKSDHRPVILVHEGSRGERAQAGRGRREAFIVIGSRVRFTVW